jgi:uncharacterized protein with NRDE domain
MCLLTLANQVRDDFPLVIAANRDEFYARPTREAGRWEDDPRIVGGRDLRAGGTWLAMREDGRFAAVTNLRGEAKPGAPSRGSLVGDFVRGEDTPRAYVERICGEYAGFHLVVGMAGGEIVHFTNADGVVRTIEAGGIFSVSNGPPESDWPKVSLGAEAMRDVLGRANDAETIAEELIAFLRTKRGGPIEGEVFVETPLYGTRASTVIVVARDGSFLFVESSRADETSALLKDVRVAGGGRL